MSLSAYRELLVTILLLVIGTLEVASDPYLILALDGEDESLTCSSSPSSWTLDGSPIETVSGITYEKTGSRTIKLNNVNHSAQGTYKCLNSNGDTLRTFTLTVVARPSFAGCDPTSQTDSSCNLLPIHALTTSNVSFNASITYSNASIKPSIYEIRIRDSNGDLLVRCTEGSPCSFKNAFAGRALRLDGNGYDVLDTLLIAVQNVSLNDTGSYSLTIEYYKSASSTYAQEYTGLVDVNVTLPNEELSSSISASSSDVHVMPSSLVTIASSSFPITSSPVFTTTTLQPEPTRSLQPGESNTERSAVPTESTPSINNNWEIFAGAIVGTFIFTIIVCLIVVTTVVVSRQRFRSKKMSDSESSSSSDLPSSSTATTEEENSDPLQDSSPTDQTDQSSESRTSKVQTTEVPSHSRRRISISQSFHSFSFGDSTPPEPREGYPKLSDDKNSTKICV